MNNSLFFYRTIPFMKQEGRVVLVDVFNMDRVSPLEDWMGVVVSLADGYHTIQQMIDFLASQYPTPPEKLEETLHSVVERLMENNVIQVSQRIVSLPYYLSGPVDELDIERVKQTIRDEEGGESEHSIH